MHTCYSILSRDWWWIMFKHYLLLFASTIGVFNSMDIINGIYSCDFSFVVVIVVLYYVVYSTTYPSLYLHIHRCEYDNVF